jgi:oxygen-independent coproporphyrinogen-3 oxidase
MTSAIASKYNLRVPRYTSYPTAPHFGPRVDAGIYRDWLAALDPAAEISLYFHVPFCEMLCWFCGCHTKIVRRYEPVANYLYTLFEELDLVADILPARARVRHVHWGGGSPTMLRSDDWRCAAERINSRFDLAADAEVAVEMDPRTATEDSVAALAQVGVTRASIGVQDFDPVVQRAINRVQPFEVTSRVIDWLRGHGIGEINLDLMYGLPNQTLAGVASMVEKAVNLHPSRVAVFGYAHVPWMKTHQRLIEEEALPGANQRWEQFGTISDYLVAAGYVAVGLDHFALPEDSLAIAMKEGRLRRNFQGYTTDPAEALVGFGASAISALPQGYAQNAAPLHAWRAAIEAGQPPIARGVPLTWEDRIRREVIEGLMCDFEVDLAAIRSRNNAPTNIFLSEIEALGQLAADGIVVLDGERVSVTTEGKRLVRVAAAMFDSYITTGAERHTRAV